MEWSMLWKDLAIGFIVGGLISAFVPADWWNALFLQGRPAWLAVQADAVLGPLIAVFTFVCSVGNVPLAAILWASGASFGGVLAFLYADLVVLPLLDTYRRYFGWRMAAYIGGVLFTTMVIAAIVVDAGFSIAGIEPPSAAGVRTHLMHFGIDYTFWLNLVFGALAAWLFMLNRRHLMGHSHHHHHGHNEQADAAN